MLARNHACLRGMRTEWTDPGGGGGARSQHALRCKLGRSRQTTGRARLKGEAHQGGNGLRSFTTRCWIMGYYLTY